MGLLIVLFTIFSQNINNFFSLNKITNYFIIILK